MNDPVPAQSAGSSAGAIAAWSGLTGASAMAALLLPPEHPWVRILCCAVTILTAAFVLRALRARMASPVAKQPDASPDEHSRLELLGGLAAGLAHELGQPLSSARVGIEGIHYLRQLGRDPSPEHLARTLSRVGLSLVAMHQTIEHLRALARPDQGVRPATAVDLGAAVDALLSERDQWLRYADTRIEWQPPATPIYALADGAGLRLILANLLRNAVEAVAGQGEGRRLVRVLVGPGPTVAVHDSGPGIPPELIERIFDPFRSTKSGPGRGIGLSLARASAERMGARLMVSSTLGSGSVFTVVLLPVREDASAIRTAPR